MFDPWKSKKVSMYVIRHGSTDLNDSNPPRYRGWQDVDLNENGIQAAYDVAGYLSYQKLGLIATSDLTRAIKTGEALINNSCEAYMDNNPNLRPLDVGDFAGLGKTDRNKKALQYYIDNPDEVIPGSSESLNQFRNRNSLALMQYACLSLSSPYPIVIVTHTSNVTTFYDEIKPGHGVQTEDGDVIGPGGLLAVYLDGDKYDAEILLNPGMEHEGTPVAS